MKSLIALLLCLVIPTTAFAGDNSYKVSYDGGSLQNLKSEAGVQPVLEPTTIKIAHGKE